MKVSKERKRKIVVGLITILWGTALLVYGPFYARGYPVPSSIGILIIILGGCYLLFDILGKNTKGE
jgi:ABC-type Fe3+-siderophore transport system permease subunit